MNHIKSTDTNPMLLQYTQDERTGVYPITLKRPCIGYIDRGMKHIYVGDSRTVIAKGDLFFLDVGTHFVEDLPGVDKRFRQVLLYYTPEQLAMILSHLVVDHHMEVSGGHSCVRCQVGRNFFSSETGEVLRGYFRSVLTYLREGVFEQNEVAESLKVTELICLLLTVHPDLCLRRRLLERADPQSELFEQQVREHLFSDISIELLAERCNKSLSSFKKDFKRHFKESPHRWFIRQRMQHACVLLITTAQSIAEVGASCNFPNTSHFIRLFKSEFGVTPACFRRESHVRQDQPS